MPAQIGKSLTDGTCLRLVLSRKLADATCEADKVTIRPVTLRGELHYQFALRIGPAERHENRSPGDAVRRVREWFGPCFADAHLFTAEADWSFRWTADGKLRAKRKRPTLRAAPPEHDRQKRYLIPEGEPCAFLAEIGVMTPDGKVRAAKQAKFRQINRYLELVDDVLDALPAGRELNVVDFGCGKSYLTFALHHLLTVIRARSAHVTGLDVKRETIEDCRRISGRLGLTGLEFQIGHIAGFEPDRPVDLAVSLHA
ncbi:MAG: methyltransferase, partial [Planctomycetaceae bacterium]